ncbi:MAG TPA: tRNA (adenosine(37)-N6)-dimethylallyltransferase MiaA [Dehalococcoidia bacterium]|nr:tRNA (adenosine(37)-N6)-dimethylallyltransferase MiaA [Dehalococcoidia bacterium]
MKCLVAIIGPTAVGKSQLALHLGQTFAGEIVNADSRQVYRYMDIGTAKPSCSDRALVRHHLIDIINPDESFSLATYQKLANEAIDDIQQRHKLPILVGGSGLYIWSVIEGWRIPPVAPDVKFRCNLEKRAREEGTLALWRELQKIDPVAATKIMPTNLRRIIRALEVWRATGQPVSRQWTKEAPPYPLLVIGLTTSRGDLYGRIDSRVDDMIKQGLVDEVRNLIAKGYSLELPSMSGMGYKQIGLFLQGRIDLPSAIQRIKYETHRFARHQYAWFRLDDARVHWLNICDNVEQEAIRLVAGLLHSLGYERDAYARDTHY